MARYFFHLREPGGYIRDEEGVDLADLEAAHVHALENVRDIISMEVRGGVIPLSHVMEIADAAGNVVRTISYVEAVRLA